MIMSDARVPVAFGLLQAALPDDALLFEGEIQPWAGATAAFSPGPRHPPGCACCAARTGAGRALASLLHARARNEVPFFRRVLAVTVSAAGRAEVEDALQNDPIASTCFVKAQGSKDVLF